MGIGWRNPFYHEPTTAEIVNTDVADSLNRVPMDFPKDHYRREVFEQMLREGDPREQRTRAYVTVENPVDDDPCPDFFTCIGNMVYGEGVPGENRNVKGCDCIGYCDPSSATCMCAKRQTYYLEGCDKGFNYNKDGRIKVQFAPIVECNDACACVAGGCQNRVSRV